MGKWGKYKKNYQKKWESEPALKGWLIENPNASSDPERREARCKICESNLRAHHTDLLRHNNTASHKAKMSSINRSKQSVLANMGFKAVPVEQKKIDLCMAVHIAAHSAIRSIDHLSEILRALGTGSSLENLRLHRTKCSKLIKNVIAPAMLTELVQDIGNQRFSLIVDESTEISNNKYLAFVARYYSEKKGQIVNEFLGFVDVERATAQKLFESTVEYLTTIGLDIRNVIGIGTDGASNMCGIRNSYYTLFREKVPQVQLVKCVCHSLHLCTSKAADELPSNLEFLIRETRNWFHDSPLRQQLYKTLYETINEGELPRQLVQLSKTRWLAWYKAVSVIIDQWLELKTHFNAMALNNDDKCWKARILKDMYNDDSNLLYLTFLKPITGEMHHANLNFQKESVEVTKLFHDLKVLLLTLASRILKPSFVRVGQAGKFISASEFAALAEALKSDGSYLSIDSVDYGNSFNIQLGRSRVAPETLLGVKHRCIRFLSVLCEQLVKRLPTNIELYENLALFSPDECLKATQPAFSKLPVSLAPLNVDREKLQMEWEKVVWVDWRQYFDGTIPSESATFWSGVSRFKNAGGDFVYENLARFALHILSLPFSNASVERVFSIMNAVKTKPRNRMHRDMLVAIMLIRLRFGVNKSCCNGFEPTEDMLKLFTSKMYAELNDTEAVVRRHDNNGEDCDDIVETLIDLDTV